MDNVVPGWKPRNQIRNAQFVAFPGCYVDRADIVLMLIDGDQSGRHLRQTIHDRLPFGKFGVGADAVPQGTFDALEGIGGLHQRAQVIAPTR